MTATAAPADPAPVSSVQAVRGYGDVLGRFDLRAGDALEILDALAAAPASRVVIHVPAWQSPGLDADPVAPDGSVYVGVPLRDTADAWQIRQGSTEAWLPKRHGLAFQVAAGVSLPRVPRVDEFRKVIR